MEVFDLFEKNVPSGTYVSVSFDDDTAERLADFQKAHYIPNPLDKSEFHSTIVYSRKPIYWRPEGMIEQEVTPVGFEVWDTRGGQKCLVLKLDSEYLQTRFKLAQDRGATHDFPDYKPHITLSYDVGPDFELDRLPLPKFPIVMDHETAEPLVVD